MHLKFTLSETLAPTKLCTKKSLRGAAVRHDGTQTLPPSRHIKLFIRTRESVCSFFLPKIIMGEEIKEDAMGGTCSGHGQGSSPSK